MTEFANNGKSNYFSSYNFIEINGRDTEGAIKNGHSRETSNL
jgi:hypothetical protein